MHFKLLLFVYYSFSLLSDTYYVNGSGVNFREQPNSNSKVIAVLDKGTAVELLAHYNQNWEEVQYKNQKGYVATNYLSSVKPNVQQKQTNETKVLVCNSENAHAYHKYECRGLSRCKAGISKITLSAAKSGGYSACKNCY